MAALLSAIKARIEEEDAVRANKAKRAAAAGNGAQTAAGRAQPSRGAAVTSTIKASIQEAANTARKLHEVSKQHREALDAWGLDPDYFSRADRVAIGQGPLAALDAALLSSAANGAGGGEAPAAPSPVQQKKKKPPVGSVKWDKYLKLSEDGRATPTAAAQRIEELRRAVLRNLGATQPGSYAPLFEVSVDALHHQTYEAYRQAVQSLFASGLRTFASAYKQLAGALARYALPRGRARFLGGAEEVMRRYMEPLEEFEREFSRPSRNAAGAVRHVPVFTHGTAAAFVKHVQPMLVAFRELAEVSAGSRKAYNEARKFGPMDAIDARAGASSDALLTRLDAALWDIEAYEAVQAAVRARPELGARLREREALGLPVADTLRRQVGGTLSEKPQPPKVPHATLMNDYIRKLSLADPAFKNVAAQALKHDIRARAVKNVELASEAARIHLRKTAQAAKARGR